MSVVRQGCILSPTIFLMVTDRVMKRVTEGVRRGINWSLTEQLEDLDFADDICLLSHTYNKMEEKLRDLDTEGKMVGLKINTQKTKSLRINVKKMESFHLNEENIEEVEEFGDKYRRVRRRC